MKKRSRSPGTHQNRTLPICDFPVQALLCSPGFIYTALPGDTFYIIADRLNIPFSDLLDANPQIIDPSRIQPGVQVRVPFIPPPIIGPIEMLSSCGLPLPQIDGVVQLTEDTTFRVPLFRATHLYMFYTPVQSDNIPQTQLLGTVPVTNEAETVNYIWNVRVSTDGFVYTVACNNRSCLTSSPIPVHPSERNEGD